MDWINVNEKYLDYLRCFEKRIPYSDYGKNKYKPFFGVLFKTNGLLYITQISHAQDRHIKMKQSLDFYKIFDPKQEHRLISVINLNYMFPIPEDETYPFEKSKVDTYRNFESNEEKSKYIDLLNKEMEAINKLNLSAAAEKIYKFKYQFPDDRVSKRCLDYKLLEKYAMAWEKKTGK